MAGLPQGAESWQGHRKDQAEHPCWTCYLDLVANRTRNGVLAPLTTTTYDLCIHLMSNLSALC